MKRIIKDYFTFSKKERVAISILLLLIAVFIALPYLIPVQKIKPVADPKLQEQLSKLVGRKQPDSGSNREDDNAQDGFGFYSAKEKKIELFAFDPNQLDANGWKKLGLREKTIHTILNYRSKGGQFRKAEDIRKIWGMRKEDADRIIPYVKMEAPEKKFQTNNNKSSSPAVIKPIDINTATEEEFKTLPGIGDYFAARIIKYRNAKGGFKSVDDIGKTYGLKDSVYQLIKPWLLISFTADPSKKININTAMERELINHPVIGEEIGRAIVVYRNQHGSYKTVEDIKKIVFINEEIFQKIAPYLTVQ